MQRFFIVLSQFVEALNQIIHSSAGETTDNDVLVYMTDVLYYVGNMEFPSRDYLREIMVAQWYAEFDSCTIREMFALATKAATATDEEAITEEIDGYLFHLIEKRMKESFQQKISEFAKDSKDKKSFIETRLQLNRDYSSSQDRRGFQFVFSGLKDLNMDQVQKITFLQLIFHPYYLLSQHLHLLPICINFADFARYHQEEEESSDILLRKRFYNETLFPAEEDRDGGIMANLESKSIILEYLVTINTDVMAYSLFDDEKYYAHFTTWMVELKASQQSNKKFTEDPGFRQKIWNLFASTTELGIPDHKLLDFTKKGEVLTYAALWWAYRQEMVKYEQNKLEEEEHSTSTAENTTPFSATLASKPTPPWKKFADVDEFMEGGMRDVIESGLLYRLLKELTKAEELKDLLKQFTMTDNQALSIESLLQDPQRLLSLANRIFTEDIKQIMGEISSKLDGDRMAKFVDYILANIKTQSPSIAPLLESPIVKTMLSLCLNSLKSEKSSGTNIGDVMSTLGGIMGGAGEHQDVRQRNQAASSEALMEALMSNHIVDPALMRVRTSEHRRSSASSRTSSSDKQKKKAKEHRKGTKLH